MLLPLLLAACKPADPVESPGQDDSVVAADDSPIDSAPEVIPGVHEDDPVEEVGSPPGMFSHQRGLYTDPFTLSLQSPVVEGVLRYTLDGSDPMGAGGAIWSEPLEIAHTTILRVAVTENGAQVLPVQTQTYLFPADVVHQSRPEGWPEQWWVADGGYPADYEMDPDIYESADYAADFPAVFERLPVVSLVVDPDDLFGEAGIHEHPTSSGSDWERPASLEILEADQSIGVRCGVRVQGGAGRRPERSPKKSFRVVFRSEYGPGRLEYPLYEDSEVTRFDTLVLRAGYNRTWTHYQHPQRIRSQYTRERYGSELQRRMGHLAPDLRPAHLFLNGVYWGLYDVEERPDAAFMADHLGGDEADYDAINSGAVSGGDLVAWDALFEAARQDLSDDAAYASVAEKLEIDGFIDYMMLNFYLGNNDWPIKNWWAGRSRDGGRFQFFSWDTELIQVYLSDNRLDVNDVGTPGELFQALRSNAEFRVAVGDHAQRLLFNDGVLTPEAAAALWTELSAEMGDVVVAESARWGDHWRDARGESADLYTKLDHWVPEYDRVMSEWMPFRRDELLSQLRAASLYPAIDAPSIVPFGGDSSQPLSLSGPGELWYTLDGGDPRLAGGALNPAALAYSGSITLSGAATVSVRSRVNGDWSALVRASYAAP